MFLVMCLSTTLMPSLRDIWDLMVAIVSPTLKYKNTTLHKQEGG